MEKSTRKRRGSITVEEFRGILRIRWTHKGKPYTISTGFPDTEVYRKVCDLKAGEIEKDILYDRFDSSLRKYKNIDEETIEPTDQALTLQELWNQYFASRRSQLEPSTIKNQYGQVTRHLANCPVTSSNSKFGTILRRSSDRPNYQELLSSLGVRLSEPSNFEFGIAKSQALPRQPPLKIGLWGDDDRRYPPLH